MKLKQIITELPSSLFEFLAKDLNSDYKVKKLPSKTVFMVLFHSIFSERNFSLRKLRENFNNKTFQRKIIGNEDLTTIHHTSFHYRLNTINYKFFERIYIFLVKKCLFLLQSTEKLQYDVIRYDSTLVDISSKLIKNIGFNQSGEEAKKVKFTIGLSELPESIVIYETKKDKSENIALKKAILSRAIPKNQIILFDRGISDRHTFDKISKNNLFITRLVPGYKIEIETENKKEIETESIKITKEITGKLFDKDKTPTKNTYRIIHSKIKEPLWDKRKETSLRSRMKNKKNAGKTKEEVKQEMLNEEIIFVTNIKEEDFTSEEIAIIYRKRWDIEVLFRFLKQELHFSHLINNSVNGIKVMVYMTLIFALLLIIYKKKNNLKGYKLVKHKMLLELQEEFYKFVIKISGGSLQKWENSTATFW